MIWSFIPGAKQVSTDVQYSSSVHDVVARQVDVAWHVNGPPLIDSLQEVRPITVEQSDVIAHTTAIFKWRFIS